MFGVCVDSCRLEGHDACPRVPELLLDVFVPPPPLVHLLLEHADPLVELLLLHVPLDDVGLVHAGVGGQFRLELEPQRLGQRNDRHEGLPFGEVSAREGLQFVLQFVGSLLLLSLLLGSHIS